MKGLIIDFFAGGGGASTGIEMAMNRPCDIAVNHDPEAIRMHKVNHPNTLHLTEDIFEVDLQKYVNGRHVELVWASPDCTSHSKAKGGQPRESGLRILPWAVYKHASVLIPETIIMENVEEIQEWGALDENGRPIKEDKGKEYDRFIKSMISLGYQFESRVLTACDYGAPTSRKRWYAVFTSGEKEPRWRKPTYGEGLKPYKQCGDYFNWSNLGKSIFDRKKPLAEATQKRIALGLKKFILDNPNPYFVKDKAAVSYIIQYHSEQNPKNARGQTCSEPLKTIDTSNRYGLVTAFVTKFYKTGIGQGCDTPLHTITTSPGHFGLVSAYLIKYYGIGDNAVTVEEPLPTITTKDRFGLVSVLIGGEKYVVKDIFLKMLEPEELKLCQGFPKSYIIDRDIDGNKYPKKEQVARIGNSVVPIMARMLVEENVG